MSHTPDTTPFPALSAATAIAAPDLGSRAPVLARTVGLKQPAAQVASARLLATAHGVYEAQVNGLPVDESVLNPGWTVYESRLQVQEVDVTAQVREGTDEVALTALLGRGWWNGDFGFGEEKTNYGEDNSFLAALEITYEDGATQVVVTDESWTATASAITFATIYDGQHEDRRFAAGDPQPVVVAEIDRASLVEQTSPLITRHESRRPERIWTSPSGRTLLDFGQNLVGWLRFTVTGPEGTEITLRHAEVLEHEELGTRPLRTAKATDSLILAGDPDGEAFEPTFTFHGFRYAEVTGWPGELTADDIEAVVVHSDIERTGWFESSHAGVNQLISNSIWSQRGNFLAVPTDCPQRDERLGWTGDIAAYAATAAYQFDVNDFLHNWLLDLHAEASLPPLSFVPFVIPDILKFRRDEFGPFAGQEPKEMPTAIWGDASVWVAEALWTAYGDLDRLRAQYPGMVLHLESVERALSPSGLWDEGFQFGDWLDPDAPPERAADAKADKAVVATACLVRSARFAAETARLIGEADGAERWQALADRTLAAFTETYVGEDGIIHSDCATVYALAIAFDLLEPATREKSAARLAEVVEAAGYKVSTGFAGTPFVTWALSETGHVEHAYRLLLEEGCPSWLYPVSMGATTIWERWDSMLPDGSINPGEMTSFNHYALGAVADWIYQVVLGIRAAEPGYRRIRIQPTPGPGLDWAKGAYDSAAGRIEVSWSQSSADGGFRLEATIPDGVEADLVLPDGTTRTVTGGTHTL
ncbi:alpha-L-rhamnosidase [Brachybacterium sp. J153]|uniref:alpha-L-rhamnosidase n=1 Tax=Brachybacterium sp. J153 TaxID=3116488 RepID=UPI002E772BFA|nr:family 78 glycoside hydrolase catalytic domain [Brachybacterium sp. J153]MEE1617679.1 family 78 glycoside hydrolase catalytic domain [Brachybacterium sp. J153]